MKLKLQFIQTLIEYTGGRKNENYHDFILNSNIDADERHRLNK